MFVDALEGIGFDGRLSQVLAAAIGNAMAERRKTTTKTPGM